MPTYIMLSSLTAQGVQTLKANPDRLREVNRDIEELGAKVVHQWATLGPFDFVNVVEAPDAETIARVSVALGARGSAKLQTLTAFSIDDSQTTEIDDALSVQGLGSGRVTVGIHIAAPALAVARDSAVDRVARDVLDVRAVAPGRLVVRDLVGRGCGARGSTELRVDERPRKCRDDTDNHKRSRQQIACAHGPLPQRIGPFLHRRSPRAQRDRVISHSLTTRCQPAC